MEILGTSLLYMALIIYMMMKTGFFIVIWTITGKPK
jgi:hypothetical protein